MTGVRALQSIATLHPAARQAEAHLDGTVEVLVEALPGIQAEHLDLWGRAGHEGHRAGHEGHTVEAAAFLSFFNCCVGSRRLQGAQRPGKHFDWAPVLLRAAN